MHLLYEEDGELKAGTVLERLPASFHVESPHGRRTKIKAANVLLSFERRPCGLSTWNEAGARSSTVPAFSSPSSS